MGRKSVGNILVRIVAILHEIGMGSAFDLATPLGCNSRTVERWVGVLIELGLVQAVEVSYGKRDISIYKLTEAYRPIWEAKIAACPELAVM